MTPADDLAIPDFLRRLETDGHAEVSSLPTKSPDAARPLGASGDAETVQHGNAPSPGDPSMQEVLQTIERLTKKQADIERVKTQLKKEFIDRLWQL